VAGERGHEIYGLNGKLLRAPVEIDRLPMAELDGHGRATDKMESQGCCGGAELPQAGLLLRWKHFGMHHRP
jgi:hypothetical protein